ncbi:flavin reductase family protein [Sinorhizobium medicae]|uniref:flavin reductase family protein n=1 Tax=Sinorhizobium medicae TaxID=110321 RepID=UPI000FDCCE2F|nr:flavin reductase family protein [Sinorhizobium medicae]RVO73546.1 flavin reductase [Sinorhizobium medicae]
MSNQDAPFNGSAIFDAKAFRRCLGQFATGVTVMTTVTDQPIGITVNSFSSLSLDPPLVMWAVGRKSKSFAHFQTAKGFAVNILASDQIAISQQFAVSDSDKFNGIDWQPGVYGIPVFQGTAASIECLIEALHDGGDHVIVVGRVLGFKTSDREVLMFAQGKYGVPAEHPDMISVGSEKIAQRPLLSLLTEAQHVLTGRFESHRSAEGLSSGESKIIGALDRLIVASVSTLMKSTYMGELETRDLIGALIERSLVFDTGGGNFTLTEIGMERREAMRRRAAAFEAELAHRIPAENYQALRAALSSVNNGSTLSV